MSQNKAIDNLRRVFSARLQDAAANSFYAKIKSVDPEKRTCSVVAEATTYDDVLLYAIENKDLKGFVMLPKVDSMVLVDRLGGSNELYVTMFSEADKVILSIGDKVTAEITDAALNYTNDKVTLEIKENIVKLSADSIEFNGATLGGLVKVGALTEKINSLIDSFNKHIHPGVITSVAGGSGAPATGTPGNTGAPSTPATFLNKADYENDKVKH